MIIPDLLVLALAILGFAWAAAGSAAPGLPEAATGGLAAGLLLAGLRSGHSLFRGGEGMGMGDVKFATAAGVWVGLADIAMLLLLAALATLVGAGAVYWSRQKELAGATAVPFGPGLAAALVILVAWRLSAAQAG